MSDVDPHSPTTAGPAPVAEPAPEPVAVPPGHTTPGGTASDLTDERPELLVGAAFAGGIVAAMLFKRLLGGRD